MKRVINAAIGMLGVTLFSIMERLVLKIAMGRVLLLIAVAVVLAACGPAITSDVRTKSSPTAVLLPALSEAPALHSPLPTPSPLGAENLVVVSETQLTTDGSVMGGVAVSPGGDRIAFLKWSDQILELSPQQRRVIAPLWVMDRDGRNAVQVTEDAQWPAWEPTGGQRSPRIAYVREIQPGWARAYLVNVQAKQSRELGEMPWQRLFWDGPERVAFVAKRHLRVWHNGQVARQSALELPDDVVSYQIYPSPDRQKLFFARNQELWLADVQTGAMQQVADGFSPSVNGVAWSPASHQVAFPLQHSGLWVMDLTTGEQRRISDLSVTGVTWSPRGDILAFTGKITSGPGTSTLTEIFLINADGTDVRQLTYNEVPDYIIAWMPDSLDLLIGRADENAQNTDIWLLSVSTPATQPAAN